MRFRGSLVRRAMLRAAIATMGAAGLIGHATVASAEDRTLSMYEIHTHETITVTYKRDGVWDEEALKKLNWFMRDWRAKEPTTMDRELIDLIWTLHTRLGSKEPIHLISAYRSSKTNEKLRRAGGGQARRSQHTLGKASDIHFPDIPVAKLRASALIQEIGGVGYYPKSGIPFVHVDVGNVRMWPRMPRLELAALFPDGKTDYVPSDGRRITKADYDRAESKGMVDHVLIAQAQGLTGTAVASFTPPPTPNPVRVMAQLSEPPAAMPVVASASDTQFKPMALAPADAEIPDQDKPSNGVVLASLGGTLPWARETSRSAEASRPIPPQSQQPDAASTTARAKVPSYQEAKPVDAPAFDDDHPDELTYVAVETARLMAVPSMAHDREVAPMSHPEQGDINYMFRDMEGSSRFGLRPSSGYLGLASIRTLTGPAVPRLYAAAPKEGPTRLASR
ncbi:DUF882 domain-containing protein [Methyloceanibacter sp. wino2]|uniref:DUF882 domain-containing protein n=1 Tax=Methyloceanibacter sp. wino2 TaxID=2170729 RepID=UPI000D3E602F|nr:DUF882 domain-containing protein [Methyloceanibacter sp. wino2]